jgi:hypothetical protein
MEGMRPSCVCGHLGRFPSAALGTADTTYRSATLCDFKCQTGKLSAIFAGRRTGIVLILVSKDLLWKTARGAKFKPA